MLGATDRSHRSGTHYVRDDYRLVIHTLPRSGDTMTITDTPVDNGVNTRRCSALATR